MAIITQHPNIVLTLKEDRLHWRNHDGVMKAFSVNEVWHTIRERGDEIFYTFMACYVEMSQNARQIKARGRWIGRRFKLTSVSPLQLQQDNHEHVFFECGYSAKVWASVLKEANFPSISPKWDDIIGWLLPLALSNNADAICYLLISLYKHLRNQSKKQSKHNPDYLLLTSPYIKDILLSGNSLVGKDHYQSCQTVLVLGACFMSPHWKNQTYVFSFNGCH
ncbi:RNA-directed DNA polymerase, eukaryota, Reverse transcriptase zinc-binding domain protein [Artemisia annua]|uniref:RNA-directed DNA polymerase, eukaryota, Reverse transcriptase zinc-binding domain protein n=1 Tax=Artemisia annua TaxID=35608 RepID=A0A2U1PFY7_ARTAN|nr:RNA-directed DNA polymerase, eukaryota, Reverse transcriptase zinc-binding domain protein [Artemisia annua]